MPRVVGRISEKGDRNDWGIADWIEKKEQNKWRKAGEAADENSLFEGQEWKDLQDHSFPKIVIVLSLKKEE